MRSEANSKYVNKINDRRLAGWTGEPAKDMETETECFWGP